MESSSVESISPIMFPIWALLVIFSFVVMWKVYTKAGRPGWATLIPIYNIIVMLDIAGRPRWWTILYFVPLVNVVISFLVSIDIAKAFGKSAAFGVIGIFFFSLIGHSIIALGESTYTQPSHS